MESKKVLIIKLGAIGDVIQTSIVATAIKEAHPEWKVHYFTTEVIAGLIENHPHIDDIIIWDRSRRKSWSYIIKMGLLLFKNRYDFIFNLTHATRNILMSYLAMPKKVVHKKTYGKTWVEDYFLTAKHTIKDLECPKRLFMDNSREVKSFVNEKIKNYPRPYFMISPGGMSDKNRQGRIWDIKNWKKLSNELVRKYGGTVFICGADNEKEYHKELESENAVLCTGEYTLAQSAYLLSKSDLMISGDTGPLHIASAYDVKTLAILGSTSPDKIKPYGENGNYISSAHDCKYCWKKRCPYISEDEKITPCMRALSVEDVMNKIEEIL